MVLFESQAVIVHQNKQSHISGEDDQYLTKVFRQYSQLGEDKAGDANGKRVLTKFNAERAAREVCKKWKGMTSEEAIKYVDDKLDGTWHNFDTNGANFIDVRDAFFWMR